MRSPPPPLAAALAARGAIELAPGEHLLDPGGSADHVWYLRHGIAKLWSLNADGREHTHAFAGADEWIAGAIDWRGGTPCCDDLAIGATALTRCAVVRIGVDELQRWRDSNPAAASYLIDVLLDVAAARLRREADLAQRSAEQRYLELLERHPGLLDQVALRDIAALLAITPVALSRIRRRLRGG